MDKLIGLLAPILSSLTFVRVLLFGLLLSFTLTAWFAYQNSDQIATHYLSPGFADGGTLTALSDASIHELEKMLRKYPNLIEFAVVIRFDFSTNSRIPIARAFNNESMRREIEGSQLGIIPIFITSDLENNNQMISLIQGEFSCSTADSGGVMHLWPGIASKLSMSCRVPIPPAFGAGGSRGYIALHLKAVPDKFQLEAIKLDMMTLAMFIYNTDAEHGSVKWIPGTPRYMGLPKQPRPN